MTIERAMTRYRCHTRHGVFCFPVSEFDCHYEKMSSISSCCAFFALARFFCLGSSGTVARIFTTTAGCEEGLRAEGGGAVGGTSSVAAVNEQSERKGGGQIMKCSEMDVC